MKLSFLSSPHILMGIDQNKPTLSIKEYRRKGSKCEVKSSLTDNTTTFSKKLEQLMEFPSKAPYANPHRSYLLFHLRTSFEMSTKKPPTISIEN